MKIKLFDSKSEAIKSYIGMVVGVAIYTFALAAFIIPSHLMSGGFTGLAMIIFYLTGFPVGYSNFIANIILIAIAYKIMGWKFVKSTFIGMTLVSVFLIVLQKYITEPLVANQPFMNAILGGALTGLGLGIIFNNGGNTGGTDIISLIINKYRNISPGKVSMYCNIVVIVSFFIVFRNIEQIVYGVVLMGVFAYCLDLTLNGNRQSYQFMIMSSKYNELADAIMNEIGGGVTAMPATGWYNKTEAEVLLIIAHRQQKSKILKKIKEIDPNAFLSVSRVEGVYGKNFEKIKH